MISHSTMTKPLTDDPRRLRSLVARASSLASEHELTSVMAGLTAPVGDPLFSDFIDFLQSALRMEDGIFRMTRERAVVYLADVDQDLAAQVLDRLMGDFEREYPAFTECHPTRLYFEVRPDTAPVTVKEVLTDVFAPPTYH